MLHYSLGDVQLQCRSPFLINKAIQQVEHTEKQFLHFLEVKHPYPPKKKCGQSMTPLLQIDFAPRSSLL